MSELRIVRGTDVTLFAGETPLFGVVSFSAVSGRKYYEVYEYLNAKPCERVPQGEQYEIRLGVMALFDQQLPDQPGFTLRVVDGDTTYCYENCRITGKNTEVKGNGCAAEVFSIEADELRKQVTAHE